MQGIHPVKIARYHLGRDTKHMVYESECTSQILALKILQKLGQDLDGLDVMIAMDNQAMLQSYSARKATPGSYLIDDTRPLIKTIEEKWLRVRLKLQWVLGHEGIEGNERADREAKQAAEGEHRNHRHEHHHLLKGLPASKLATKQHLKKKTHKAYGKEFCTSPRYERSSRFDPKSPVSNFMKIATKLTRHQASILAQLHMSHASLESPICPSCGTKPEMTTHFLMHCISYVTQRRRLQRTLGRDQALVLKYWVTKSESSTS